MYPVLCLLCLFSLFLINSSDDIYTAAQQKSCSKLARSDPSAIVKKISNGTFNSNSLEDRDLLFCSFKEAAKKKSPDNIRATNTLLALCKKHDVSTEDAAIQEIIAPILKQENS